MNFSANLKLLGFTPKEGVTGVFVRHFPALDNYLISVNVASSSIDYGQKIQCDSATTQNFSQEENWVVLECVCRLLEKGYPPECITLEKTWPSGHGKSARLDICISRQDGSDYMLIECKTWGAEYNKALIRLQKDGGQLFTYFKFSNKANVIMLYASQIGRKDIEYRNDIILIQDDYRLGDVQDFYKLWNKLTLDNGVFEDGVTPYQFRSKYLTPEDLKDINHSDSSLIFNQFLEILRHNVVSDKPNAFNKIFTLFLCKVYDEKQTPPKEKLRFQWEEGVDDDISFQLRLTDLYQEGMKEFLDKEVTDISEKEIRQKYKSLQDNLREQLLSDFKRLRLEKNNEFAIKEVFDNKSFQENAKVVKEVVQLLQKFRIRYNKRQQYLSDFFEQLLTTGLKQEAGQFFTPVPIAQFIIKSLPVREITLKKLKDGRKDELLPYVIDYATGSGHFLTEVMHELQHCISLLDPNEFIPDTAKNLRAWNQNHFDWAQHYIYGVEKDYRLVKVGKVGCYLHGDGLANIVHSDGLGSFLTTPEYKGRLLHIDKNFSRENQQFDIVISNPPYSVEAFKGNARQYYGEQDFTLYNDITDDSSAIECLFIERTQQLLKEGGVAGVILPRSILSNGGVYEKARTLLLKHFDIVAIAELGSNTFMATGTNTVTLFMRRRDNYLHQGIKDLVAQTLTTHQEVTINGVVRPISAYLEQVWSGLSFADYKTLLGCEPNEAVKAHELYQWLDKNFRQELNAPEASVKKSKSNDDKDYQTRLEAAKRKYNEEYWSRFLTLEQEKIIYFIRAYPQQVVVVKSGEKEVEKQFLGYYFSDRRGHEGIHPNSGTHIDECTKLFHPERLDDPDRASTYILQAFQGDYSQPIAPSLEKHVHRTRLVEMIEFGRPNFEKTISLAGKKKVSETRASLWPMVRLGEVVKIGRGASPRPIERFIATEGVNWIKIGDVKPEDKYITKSAQKITLEGAQKSKHVRKGDLIISNSMSVGRPYILEIDGCVHDGWLVLEQDYSKSTPSFLYYALTSSESQSQFHDQALGGVVKNLNIERVKTVQIPLPPLEVQTQIVNDIEAIEAKEATAKAKIEGLEQDVKNSFSAYVTSKSPMVRLGEVAQIKKGESITRKVTSLGTIKVVAGGIDFAYFHNVANRPANTITISASGANAGYINLWSEPIFASDCSTVAVGDAIDTKYLFYWLKSIQSQLFGLARGAAQPHVYPKDIAMLLIPLLPLTTQNELVVKITALESLIATEKATLDALAAERKAVFERAVYAS